MLGRMKWASCAVVAVTLVTTGCASGSAGARRQYDENAVRVVVENQNWMDMTVYVQSPGGVKTRIGTVSTGQTQVFRVSASLVTAGGLRLIGDPIGGRELSETDMLAVHAGSTAYWRIGNRPATSFAVVR